MVDGTANSPVTEVSFGFGAGLRYGLGCGLGAGLGPGGRFRFGTGASLGFGTGSGFASAACLGFGSRGITGVALRRLGGGEAVRRREVLRGRLEGTGEQSAYVPDPAGPLTPVSALTSVSAVPPLVLPPSAADRGLVRVRRTA
jgi:hypothetical protein